MALNQPGGSALAGLLAVLGVTVCSGLAGVYFEKVIKDSPMTTSLWIRNVQISVYSLFPAFFIGVLFIDGETVARNGFFDGYNWIVVLSIAVQSFGGIVAAFCIYYADNISKNFAVSISMVLSSLASVFFFGFEATGNVSCSAKTLKGNTLTSNSFFLVHRSYFSRPISTVCRSMPVHDLGLSEYIPTRTSQLTSLQMKGMTCLSSCRRRP